MQGDGAPVGDAYLRSDDPALATGWRSTMPIYSTSHHDEAAVVPSLELDASTRTIIDAALNRVSFRAPAGRVEVFYDEGVNEPFHVLRYFRDEPFAAQTWTSSADLREKWDIGARLAADYLSKLTNLTPVVLVGAGTDADYADALDNGYRLMLAVDAGLLVVEQNGFVPAQGPFTPPIFYGFYTATRSLRPFFSADSTEGGPLAIPLERPGS